MKENKGLVWNVGTASILLILLVFVLSVFSVLSIRASNSEWKLAQKTGDSVKAYYEADTQAEYMLCHVDTILKNTDMRQLDESIKELEKADDTQVKGLTDVSLKLEKGASFLEGDKKEIGTLSFAIKEQENSSLKVELQLFTDRSYEVKSWKTVRKAWELDDFEDGAELWDGTVK